MIEIKEFILEEIEYYKYLKSLEIDYQNRFLTPYEITIAIDKIAADSTKNNNIRESIIRFINDNVSTIDKEDFKIYSPLIDEMISERNMNLLVNVNNLIYISKRRVYLDVFRTNKMIIKSLVLCNKFINFIEKYDLPKIALRKEGIESLQKVVREKLINIDDQLIKGEISLDNINYSILIKALESFYKYMDTMER